MADKNLSIAVIGRGRMGTLIAEGAKERGWKVVAHVDKDDLSQLEQRCDGDVDVVIDFSNPDAWGELLPAVSRMGCALVSGVTGITDDDRAAFAQLASTVPVCWSSNYSKGVAVLARACALVAGVVAPEWDVEIVERHHNQKRDAPSGTALTLADAVDPDGTMPRVMGRSGLCPRQPGELGISAVRGGTVAGMHEVGFYGPHEWVTLTHNAEDRAIFANGALDCAAMLAGRQPGSYEFSDMLFEGIDA